MMAKGKQEVAVFCTMVLICFVLMIWLVLDAPSAVEVTVMNYAISQDYNYEEYPDSLLRLLARNPETEDFVLTYPAREKLEIDLSDCDRSRGVPLLLQWDKRWGYRKYGNGLVGETGSGPLCLSMVGYYLTGDEQFYPDKVVAFALKNDYASPDAGSQWALIGEGAKTLGLNVKEVAVEENKIAAYLKAGDPIIAVMGPGDFTDSGHYIVLTGYENGMLSVNDPDSRIRSEKRWEYDALAGQIRNLWVFLGDGEM